MYSNNLILDFSCSLLWLPCRCGVSHWTTIRHQLPCIASSLRTPSSRKGFQWRASSLHLGTVRFVSLYSQFVYFVKSIISIFFIVFRQPFVAGIFLLASESGIIPPNKPSMCLVKLHNTMKLSDYCFWWCSRGSCRHKLSVESFANQRVCLPSACTRTGICDHRLSVPSEFVESDCQGKSTMASG